MRGTCFTIYWARPPYLTVEDLKTIFGMSTNSDFNTHRELFHIHKKYWHNKDPKEVNKWLEICNGQCATVFLNYYTLMYLNKDITNLWYIKKFKDQFNFLKFNNCLKIMERERERAACVHTRKGMFNILMSIINRISPHYLSHITNTLHDAYSSMSAQHFSC